MNRRTTRRLLAGILIGAIGGLTVALGGDVTVQQGNITATGLTLTGSATITGSPTVTGDLHVEGDLTAGDIDSDCIGCNSYPQGYFDNVTVNADANRLEAYVPSEGKFYDLRGAVVETFPGVIAPATEYKPTYFLDADTGQVKSSPKPISKKYRLQAACRVDEATGQLINEHTGEAVPREQAVEVYNPSDRTYYDLEGKALRTEQNPAQVEYVTEYYLDRHTGEVKSERRPVRQLYVVKKGLRFDKKTGQFTDTATGNAVAAQDAVVQIRQ